MKSDPDWTSSAQEPLPEIINHCWWDTGTVGGQQDWVGGEGGRASKGEERERDQVALGVGVRWEEKRRVRGGEEARRRDRECIVILARRGASDIKRQNPSSHNALTPLPSGGRVEASAAEPSHELPSKYFNNPNINLIRGLESQKLTVSLIINRNPGGVVERKRRRVGFGIDGEEDSGGDQGRIQGVDQSMCSAMSRQMKEEKGTGISEL
ncbi:hypothetical protein EYF80_031578 [Liparis tanakae]|uniref:Uncharacterized protein n=1 Tax=Liparis tanakae TaxID=230148 RepID=A0A4Z2GXA2_9TELE|nr:hypothetical protein EYF80_031578 [Liparis tanakae]